MNENDDINEVIIQFLTSEGLVCQSSVREPSVLFLQ